MKLPLIRITFLICIVFLFACVGYEPVEKKALTNARLYLHKQISGTRVFMIPPPGFITSDSIAGFIKGKHASITVAELVNSNFPQTDPIFSNNKLQKPGIEVLTVEEKTINGIPAKMIMMDSAGRYRSYKMLLGDSSFATMISGQFPNDDEQTQLAVTEAIEGIWFDRFSNHQEFLFTPFYVNDNPSKFKYLKTSEDTLFYTIPDKRFNADTGSVLMLVTHMSHNGRGDIMISVNKMFNKIAVSQGAYFRPDFPDFLRVNNKHGCELKYEVTINNMIVMMYSLAIEGKEFDIVIGGVSRDCTREALREYRSFAKAILIKKE